ncbi:MAG: hypothetical protein AB1454_13535 [Candidatus Auribacterota bacterium]
MKSILKTILYISVLSFCAQSASAYSDRIHWWYTNATTTPGEYMVNGPGIDSTNGGLVNGNYWIGTDFRNGDIVFNRNLQSGVNSVYMGGQLAKTPSFAYQAGLEEIVNIRITSNYSNGDISLNSAMIRYSQSGIWTAWEDIGFSATIPYVQYPSPTQVAQTDYALNTEEPYESYELKFNITVPVSSLNKQYILYFTSVDDPNINFDPLTASSSIPEPMSVMLIASGAVSLLIKRRR